MTSDELNEAIANNDPNLDALIDLAKRQLWSVEPAESSDSKYYIRNVCTEKVLKKINDEETHEHSDKVYAGQKKYCPVKHFDIALVDKTDCVDADQYNVNHCLWDITEV